MNNPNTSPILVGSIILIFVIRALVTPREYYQRLTYSCWIYYLDFCDEGAGDLQDVLDFSLTKVSVDPRLFGIKVFLNLKYLFIYSERTQYYRHLPIIAF